jgi:hypothetical protein
VLVVSVQPTIIVVELELVVAEVAEVLAHAAVARLLGVARGLVAEGLVAEEQKIGVDYNTCGFHSQKFSTTKQNYPIYD